MDAIPIEDLVQEAKSDLINWGSNTLLASIYAAAPWTTSPWCNWLVKIVVQAFIAFLVGKGELGAFMLNAKFLSSSQAKDYRASVAKRLSAPDNIPDAEWEKIENEANHNFVQLVRLGA